MSASTRRLKAEEQKLLDEVVSKYLPDDSERLLPESPDRWLSPLRQRVRDAIGQELAGSGFDQNYEPTARGLLLEGLIDYLNRLEFAPKSN
jgi:hypothetical protein